MDDVVGGGHQVGDPGVPIVDLAALDDTDLDEVDQRSIGVAVERQPGDPFVVMALAAVLADQAMQQVAAAQAVDVLVQAAMVTGFGDQEEREAPSGQELDEGLFGVKTVGNDNCGHAGIVGAEPVEHPAAGVDFAILLVVVAAVGVRVVNELGSEGQHLAPTGVDDGSLQDVMVIAGDAVFGSGQTVFAVDRLGTEIASGIEGNEVAGVEDLEVLEPFEALQATDPGGEGMGNGGMVMAVDDVAELGIGGNARDAEGGGEVVGLQTALEAALELEEGAVLDE